jgi:CBS domain-containing protein/ribosome-associated translation inhibitor RaiA
MRYAFLLVIYTIHHGELNMAYQSIKNLKAEDVMSKSFITATEDENLSDVLAKLKKFNVHELPVIRKNRLVGLVSYDTIIKRRNLPLSTKVEHIMSTPPKLSKDAPLTTVAENLMSSGFRLIPITSKGKILAGVVSRMDLLKGVMQDKNLANMEITSLMTREPQCIRETDNISQARTLMKRLSMRTLPVLNNNEKLVGVIGVKDIAKIWTPKTKESTGELKGEKISLDVEVKSVMNPDPIFIEKEGKVKEVIKLMREHDISSVLITEKSKPIGIITPLDIIELLVRMKERESLYVQITGLEEEDAEVYDDMYELIRKYMSKINKIDKTRIFALHVVQYHNKSFVKEYEMRARLSTKKQMFYAQSNGWDLMKTLDDVLEALERMVTKEKDRRLDAIKKRTI